MLQLRVLGCVCVMVFAGSSVRGREWNSVDGVYRLEGEIAAGRDKTVWIKTTEGQIKRIELDRLSADDQEYARQWLFNQEEMKQLQANPPALAEGHKIVYVATSRLNAATAARQPAASLYKAIYSGSCTTFHLIHRDGPTLEWTSTVSYHIQEHTQGWHSAHYLASLQHAKTDLAFMHWTPRDGDGFIEEWRIARVPDCCGCYRIYARGRGEWQLIDHAYLSAPK
jgi:hypothetical protein